MSTRFADVATPPLIPEADVRKAADEAMRLVLAWLASSSKPDASSMASENLDASDTVTDVRKRALWITAEDTDLRTLLSDLAALLQRNDYDEDYVKPTNYAWTRTWELLDTAGAEVGDLFPLGTVYPHGSGGLRIEWIGPEKELRLAISADASKPSYIYYEDGDKYDADYNVSASNLANWLRWFDRNGRGAR